MLVIQPRHFVTSMDCSPPGSPVHGILQAILEWVAIPFSRGYSRPRDPPGSPASPLQADSFPSEPPKMLILTDYKSFSLLSHLLVTSLLAFKHH